MQVPDSPLTATHNFFKNKFNSQLTSNLTHTQPTNLSYKSLPSSSQLTSNLTSNLTTNLTSKPKPNQPNPLKMQPATPITTAAPTEVPQPQEARGKFLPLHPSIPHPYL